MSTLKLADESPFSQIQMAIKKKKVKQGRKQVLLHVGITHSDTQKDPLRIPRWPMWSWENPRRPPAGRNRGIPTASAMTHG